MVSCLEYCAEYLLWSSPSPGRWMSKQINYTELFLCAVCTFILNPSTFGCICRGLEQLFTPDWVEPHPEPAVVNWEDSRVQSAVLKMLMQDNKIHSFLRFICITVVFHSVSQRFWNLLHNCWCTVFNFRQTFQTWTLQTWVMLAYRVLNWSRPSTTGSWKQPNFQSPSSFFVFWSTQLLLCF